jgi:two-component system phosphate regulon sensor histidine kinase PhoR
MQKKIMVNYVLMILLGTLITGIFSYHVAQKHYISEVENKLLVIGNLLKKEILALDSIQDNNILNTFAIEYGDVTKTRITFINREGKVLGDSSTDYTTLENHANRPEIIAAFDRGMGESTRYSTSVGKYLKYIAIKIDVHPEPIVLRLSIPINDINSIRKRLVSFITLGIFIAFFIASLLGVQFTNKFTKPIRQLTFLSRKIAKGNFKGNIQIDAHNEIGELAQSFIYMKNELDKTITQLSQRNSELETIINSMIGGLIALDRDNRIMLINNNAIELFDIKNKQVIGKNILLVIRDHAFNKFLEECKSELVPKGQQVQDIQYNNKYYKIYSSPIQNKSDNNVIGTLIIVQDITNIRRLEQIRSEFVSNVTHELKTPLTSIKGFIDTLKNGAIYDKEVAERFLDIIDIEAERLTILIEDILELSEIETKKHDIRIDNYHLEDIIKEVVDIVDQSAQKKNVQVHYTIEPSISQVRVNKDRLKQMLINLVDNGIKYSKNQGGEVKILCKRFKKMIEFHICDNGIGISEQHIPRLFERFYRVDKGRSRSQGGTGLGLSIVKHIVNLYDGDIQVKSEVGKGTEFIIKLPIAI